MNRKRKEIMMEKARAKRRRRKPKEAMGKGQDNTAIGVTAKVIELAEGAAAQVGELVKTAAGKIASAGAGDA
jgi:hypothetical protein